MKKNAKLLPLIISLVVLLIVGLCYFIYTQTKPVSKDLQASKIKIEIPYGYSVKKVAKTLKDQNLIKNSTVFYVFARLPQLRNVFYSQEDNTVNFVLKSGTYYISPAMNIAQIQNLLSSGQQEFVKVSIPEGLTISKIAAILETNRICPSQDFINACHNTTLTQKYEIPGETLEGYLFPDTYYMNIDMDPKVVACLMVDTFFEKIKTIPNIQEKNAAQLFEIITLASIVEREYRVKDEAPLIASVFKNRIRRNIGLYSCATVEYILTEIEGRPHPEKILIEDTKIDNPYNTYKWAGLPPGPISNPGIIAIEASTNTPKTDYYFFQVVNPEEGRHVFTTTFEEHKVNHNLYTKKAAGK